MIQIKKILGLDIKYDEQRERFYLYDEAGTEIGSGGTQAEVEKQAKSHSKQKFTRVAIIRFRSDHVLMKVELTSYNGDDMSTWVSMEKPKGAYGSGREKINLGSSYGTGYYEATEKNLVIAAEIEAKGKLVKVLQVEAEALKEQLEKRINKEYFGIKEVK